MDDDKISEAAAFDVGNVLAAADVLKSAGATMKGKKRPINVTGRGGEVVDVRPHVAVIEGLLFQAGITEALQDGLRPKTVLCAVCRCVVKVKPGRYVPTVCKKHKDKKLCPRGCGAAVAARSESCFACKTPEERSEAARKTHARKTPEQRSEKARKAHARKTPEQRIESARRASCALSTEQRIENTRKANASRTPEQRSEVMRKAWETRRAKQAAKG